MAGISSFIRSVVARLDGVARLVENHEGLAESAMRAARDRLERATSALDAARRESTRTEATLAEQRAEVERCFERARAEPTEAAALESLRRAHRVRGAAEDLERQQQAYGETIRRLADEAGRIRAQLASLTRTRHLLRAREERAEALHLVVGGPAEGLRGALERWEQHVASVETTGHAAFEASRIFDPEPLDEADLLAELAELRRNP
jgi:phage shock protein A